MKVKGKHFETIWVHPNNEKIVQIIDQRKLPFSFEIIDLKSSDDAFVAISDMAVRGAPLIGATGAFGVYLATLEAEGEADFQAYIHKRAEYLKSSRPTAVNLAFAIDELVNKISESTSSTEAQALSLKIACKRVEKEREYCKAIGKNGMDIIEKIYREKGEPVNILTHCNAGWLACIDYGTATAPVYLAHEKGIPVHVWVDETRPRNQGARLTAWELTEQGVPNTIIADNTGGHLMQHGMVDMAIVGSDRTTRTGDVANKIGTYLKALAAHDNGVPFYVALPSSSFDFSLTNGIKEIPIELRDETELSKMEGFYRGEVIESEVIPVKTNFANYGFDVTPARLVDGLITERGVCKASEPEIVKMFTDLIH